ncbi:hypothetical protein B0H19DRAFT_967761 [Mycena capillaripes]|nr:hypothetical protein B0H19DRAFT_967761 [Mycena capillaripes]
MSRLCRLLAYLESDLSSNPGTKIFAEILQPEDLRKVPVIQPINDSEQATYFYTKATALDVTMYNMILQYLNVTGHHGQYHSHTSLGTLPPQALVLPPLARRCTEFHLDGRTYSCNSSHPGNSFIQFYDRQISGYRTGVIDKIFEIPLQGYLRKFILTLSHRDLNQVEVSRTPYDPVRYPRFMTKIVEDAPSGPMLLIEPEHITTHLATYKPTKNSFGIGRDIRLVCWALNRGRREYPAHS